MCTILYYVSACVLASRVALVWYRKIGMEGPNGTRKLSLEDVARLSEGDAQWLEQEVKRAENQVCDLTPFLIVTI